MYIPLRFPSIRKVQKIIHIGLDIMKLFHFRSGLLIGSIGFPLLFQKSGIFLPQRLNRGQLCNSQAVKMFLCRLVQQDFRLML